MSLKSKKSNDKRSFGISRILVVVILVFVAFSAVNFIGAMSKATDKKEKIEQLKLEIEQQQLKIDDVDYLLQEGNELEYVERIAREKYGYAAPGERAFYVSDGG